MEKKTLGAFIAHLRKEKGLTQKHLAERLNVSDKTVSHWECDETSPDISLLPELAEHLGVTVDELLKGEKNTVQSDVNFASVPPESESIFDKAGNFASKTFNKIRDTMSADVTERYRLFRILSFIGEVIAFFVLIVVTLSSLFSGSYSIAPISLGIIALIGSLWTILISLGLTLGARFLFSRAFLPEEADDAKEKEYIFKANWAVYNNVFTLFCSLPMSLAGIEILPIGANLLIVIAFLIVARLSATKLLLKKGYLCKDSKQQLLFKYISIFIISSLIVSGSLLFFRAVYNPTAKSITFENADDFKAYMETPTEKPEDAYLIEGVYATTEPATIMLTPGWNDEIFNDPIEDITEEEPYITETVYGNDGKKILEFFWRNGGVYEYRYNSNDDSFLVITYEEEINRKDKLLLVDDGAPIVIVMFVVVDALICSFVYKKKKNSILFSNK